MGSAPVDSVGELLIILLLIFVIAFLRPAEGKEWTTTQLRELGLSSNRVTALTEGPKGELWVGTSSGEIASFNGREWKSYPNDALKQQAEAYVNAIVSDKGNSVWAIIGEKLWRCTNDKWYQYRGTIEVGIAKTPVSLTGQECWDSYILEVEPEISNGIPFISGELTDLSIDSEGNLWIASRSEKIVFKFNGKLVSCWNDRLFPLGMPYEVFQLDILPQGDMLIAFVDVPLHILRFREDIWSELPSPPTSVSTRLSGDIDGKIWGGASDGIYCLSVGKWGKVSSWDNNEIESTRAVQADNAGGVWAVAQTKDGRAKLLHVAGNKNFREIRYPHDVSLEKLRPVVMLLDKQGLLWVGDEVGVHLLEQTNTSIHQQTWGQVKVKH